MKYSEDGLKVGDKVICIKSTPWYKEGDIGGVAEIDARNAHGDFSGISANISGGTYFIRQNTIKRYFARSWLYRFLFQRIG